MVVQLQKIYFIVLQNLIDYFTECFEHQCNTMHTLFATLLWHKKNDRDTIVPIALVHRQVCYSAMQ